MPATHEPATRITNPTQRRALEVAAEYDPIWIDAEDVAWHAHVSAITATKALRSLEQAGLLTRQKLVEDNTNPPIWKYVYRSAR